MRQMKQLTTVLVFALFASVATGYARVNSVEPLTGEWEFVEVTADMGGMGLPISFTYRLRGDIKVTPNGQFSGSLSDFEYSAGNFKDIVRFYGGVTVDADAAEGMLNINSGGEPVRGFYILSRNSSGEFLELSLNFSELLNFLSEEDARQMKKNLETLPDGQQDFRIELVLKRK